MKKDKYAAMGVMLTACVLSGCVLSGCTAINGTSMEYVDAGKYQVGGAVFEAAVSEIEVDWIGGNVTIEPSQSGSYEIEETSDKELKDDKKVHYYLDGDKLRIKYCASGIRLMDTDEKELVIRVPEDSMTDSLEINSVSADFSVTGIAVGDIDVSTVSGDIAADVTSVKSFDVESVSGNFGISSPLAPEDGDYESVSGNLALTLPESAGFTVDCDSVSGEISSEINGKLSDSKFICGSGDAEYDVETVSGNVKIMPYTTNSYNNSEEETQI